MIKFADEALEHWGEIFTRNNLQGYGLTFEQFLQAPATWLERWAFQRPHAPGTDEHEPLLPAQQRVADRLRDDELVELMRALQGFRAEDAEHWPLPEEVDLLQALAFDAGAARLAEAHEEQRLASAAPTARVRGPAGYCEPLHHQVWPRRRGPAA